MAKIVGGLLKLLSNLLLIVIISLGVLAILAIPILILLYTPVSVGVSIAGFCVFLLVLATRVR